MAELRRHIFLFSSAIALYFLSFISIYGILTIETKKVVVGFDNHKPKGHHFHHHDSEELYNFVSVDQLIDDFWDLAEKEGYII